MDAIGIFATATIFTLMLTIGVNDTVQQLISLWRRSKVLLRALLAAIVLVPMLVVLLLWIFDLPPEVATGLALLAAAPGAPLTTKRAQMAGADPVYVSSLQLTLALLAVVVTPLYLAIFFSLFDLTIEAVSPINVASQIARITFLPVVVGLLLQRFAPKFTIRVRKPLNVLANTMFVLLVLLVIVILAVTPELRTMLLLDWTTIAAIVIMAVSALAIGHFLGGRRAAQHGGLATACVARNFGLALYVAGLSEAGAESVPTLVVYLVIGALLGILYALWNRRQVEHETDAQTHVPA